MKETSRKISSTPCATTISRCSYALSIYFLRQPIASINPRRIFQRRFSFRLCPNSKVASIDVWINTLIHHNRSGGTDTLLWQLRSDCPGNSLVDSTSEFASDVFAYFDAANSFSLLIKAFRFRSRFINNIIDWLNKGIMVKYYRIWNPATMISDFILYGRRCSV